MLKSKSNKCRAVHAHCISVHLDVAFLAIHFHLGLLFFFSWQSRELHCLFHNMAATWNCQEKDYLENWGKLSCLSYSINQFLLEILFISALPSKMYLSLHPFPAFPPQLPLNWETHSGRKLDHQVQGQRSPEATAAETLARLGLSLLPLSPYSLTRLYLTAVFNAWAPK